jgi:hypothetical protein
MLYSMTLGTKLPVVLGARAGIQRLSAFGLEPAAVWICKQAPPHIPETTRLATRLRGIVMS